MKKIARLIKQRDLRAILLALVPVAAGVLIIIFALPVFAQDVEPLSDTITDLEVKTLLESIYAKPSDLSAGAHTISVNADDPTKITVTVGQGNSGWAFGSPVIGLTWNSTNRVLVLTNGGAFELELNANGFTITQSNVRGGNRQEAGVINLAVYEGDNGALCTVTAVKNKTLGFGVDFVATIVNWGSSTPIVSVNQTCVSNFPYDILRQIGKELMLTMLPASAQTNETDLPPCTELTADEIAPAANGYQLDAAKCYIFTDIDQTVYKLTTADGGTTWLVNEKTLTDLGKTWIQIFNIDGKMLLMVMPHQ
jgi:hypothetical protein